MIRSEWQLIIELLKNGPMNLSEYELYKACVPEAINGIFRNEAQTLSWPFQLLLNVRMRIFQQDYLGAFSLLKSLSSNNNKNERQKDFIFGDQYYLYGTILHRKKHPNCAFKFFIKAENLYKNGGDEHKLLRCMINRHICENNLDSYSKGEIYFLKQECFKKQFLDLVGNIEKSLACELMSRGDFLGAGHYAQNALLNYEKAGCAEDSAMARLLLAIALFCQGEKKEAQSQRTLVHLNKGKIDPLLDIFDQLILGQRPHLLKGHMLFNTPWPIDKFRKNSITGLALALLKKGPISRDELIFKVWGPDALDASYITRLHTVITALRNKHHLKVSFDGTHYSLLENAIEPEKKT